MLQVTERGPDGRPAEILAVAVGGMYDTSIHGWRAYGFAVQRDVEWAPDGTAQVRNSGPQFP